MACFASAGESMTHVWTPFILATSGRLTIALANIKLQSGAAGALPCPH